MIIKSLAGGSEILKELQADCTRAEKGEKVDLEQTAEKLSSLVNQLNKEGKAIHATKLTPEVRKGYAQLKSDLTGLNARLKALSAKANNVPAWVKPVVYTALAIVAVAATAFVVNKTDIFSLLTRTQTGLTGQTGPTGTGGTTGTGPTGQTGPTGTGGTTGTGPTGQTGPTGTGGTTGTGPTGQTGPTGTGGTTGTKTGSFSAASSSSSASSETGSTGTGGATEIGGTGAPSVLDNTIGVNLDGIPRAIQDDWQRGTLGTVVDKVKTDYYPKPVAVVGALAGLSGRVISAHSAAWKAMLTVKLPALKQGPLSNSRYLKLQRDSKLFRGRMKKYAITLASGVLVLGTLTTAAAGAAIALGVSSLVAAGVVGYNLYSTPSPDGAPTPIPKRAALTTQS
jgi:hypothetical protein